jgi:hypothetical protein
MSIVIVLVIFIPGIVYALFEMKKKRELEQQEYDEAIMTDRTVKPKKEIQTVDFNEDIETGAAYEPTGLA